MNSLDLLGPRNLKAKTFNCGLWTMDFELWTIDSSKSSNLQTTAGGPNDEQAELQLKELEAEDLWPVLNEEDKKREKQMGDNKEFEVKAQTRKQGGNGTIQQMATESRSGQKKQKNKKCPKRQPSG